MKRARVLLVVAIAVLAGWSQPAAAEVRQLALTVDDDGLVWATVRVSCDPDVVDDVEVDVYISQGTDEAHIDLFEPCPAHGLLELRGASFDSDRMEPGRAEAYVVEQQYCIDGGGVTCAGGDTNRSVILRPSRR